MNLKEIQFFAFDFDGVLVNNTEAGINNLIKIAGDYVGHIPYPFLQKYWGSRPLELFKVIQNYLGLRDEEIKLLRSRFKEDYTSYQINTRLLRTIGRLKAHGRLVPLITSRTRMSLENVCQEINFPLKTFSFIQTPDDYSHVKPDGRVFCPLFDKAKMLNINPNKIVYIGDTKYDQLAALSSQPALKFIGVISGASSFEDFLSSGSTNNDVLALSYEELAPTIDQAFGFVYGKEKD